MMKNRSFKDMVIENFPELTVKRDDTHPQLFIMLNKHGEMFDEVMTSYSASKTWEIAHRLMLRGELKPYWLEDHKKSMKEFNDNVIEDKQYCQNPLTDQEIENLFNSVLMKHELL